MKGSDLFAVMLLIGLIGGGVFAGYMLGIMRVGDIPRKDHRIIAEQISAENVPYQIDCKLEYARSDNACLLYTSPSPRDATLSRMPSSA